MITVTIGNGADGSIDGAFSDSSFVAPFDVAMSSAGAVLFISDAGANTLRKANFTSGADCILRRIVFARV